MFGLIQSIGIDANRYQCRDTAHQGSQKTWGFSIIGPGGTQQPALWGGVLRSDLKLNEPDLAPQSDQWTGSLDFTQDKNCGHGNLLVLVPPLQAWREALGIRKLLLKSPFPLLPGELPRS